MTQQDATKLALVGQKTERDTSFIKYHCAKEPSNEQQFALFHIESLHGERCIPYVE